MRRSTRLASGAWLRRAFTFLLPLLAVCALTPLGEADARSQAASEQAVAGVLAQSTGLAPSQVTSVNTCAPARPGYAQCDAEALVLRSNHARVRPNVHGGPTFTQVFPSRRLGTPSARSADAGASPAQAGTPAWLQQAYDLTYLSLNGGVGDTVAIVDVGDDPSAEADLSVFRSAYGLGSCTTENGCFKKVNQSGNTSPLPAQDSDWQPEESLDLDAVSALCPNCRLLLVEAASSSVTDLDHAVVAAESLGATQISNSWSSNWSTPIDGTYTFGSSGPAVIAATGDTGYLGVGEDAYPAAFPGVTAAGGTTLAPATGGGSARGFGESAWSLSDGWGASSGCDVSESRPAYQLDLGCTGRTYADLSADADPETGLMVYDSGNGGWLQYGGTSLATPLIAAYEAITGVHGATPQWAYNDSALLNDPVAGSSGNCPSSILYICNAGPGYDGPTGIGSISGAVVAGAPGIGGPSFGYGVDNTYTASVGATTATLSGGVYPNGLDTTYYWQYGPTTSYGAQTSPVDIGAGQAPVPAPGSLSGLVPGVTYHYRLVAENADGTAYGYDSSLTAVTAPADVVAPATGGPVPGSAISTPGAGAGPPRWTARPQISADPGRAGDTLAVTPGRWTGSAAGGDRTQVMRCTNTCVPAGPSNVRSYEIRPADVGSVLWVKETAWNAAGTTVVWSVGSVGPVRSTWAATVVLFGGQGALRNFRGATLAFASIDSRSPSSDHGRFRGGSRVLGLHRARGVSGSLTAWVCSMAGTAGGPPKCTARISLGARATARLPASMTGKVRVVVIRRGR
jgi:hypothetical protein